LGIKQEIKEDDTQSQIGVLKKPKIILLDKNYELKPKHDF